MSDADFTIKQNDFGAREPLRARLTQLKVDPETGEPELDGEGNEQFVPIDLTGCTVRICLESEGARVKTSPMTIVGAATDGVVEYAFEKGAGAEPADLAVAGDYEMEFEITGAGGASVQSVPNEGYLLLRVEADKGPEP